MDKNAYKKIDGWFNDHSAAALEQLIKDHNVKTVIEIGSFLGRSTAFFAARVEKVYAIDPFMLWDEGRRDGNTLAWTQGKEDFYGLFMKNMRDAGLDRAVVPLLFSSAYAASVFPDLCADLVYIDASHDYESVKRDLALWTPRASLVLTGDDYDQNWPGVGRAVDELIGPVDHYPHTGFWSVKAPVTSFIPPDFM